VNESGYKFTVVGDRSIRFGLGAIRNVGHSAIDSILLARNQDGPFTSFFDFVRRVDLRVCNRRVFEALICAGALDGLAGHRAQYFAALDTAIREASLRQEDISTGQVSLFGGDSAATSQHSDVQQALPNVAEWPEAERLAREKEILGFYTSGHPLEPFRVECELFATHHVADIGPWRQDPMSLCVVITAVKKQISKRTGAEFARLVLEDFSGSAEVMVFPEKWQVLADQIRTDTPLLLKGGYTKRDRDAENPSFVVESVTRLAEARANGQLKLALELNMANAHLPQIIAELRGVCDANPGSAPIELHWSDGNGLRERFRSRSLTVEITPLAMAELRSILGDSAVKLQRV
jgi:DNA polymerase-3 subunit alpha